MLAAASLDGISQEVNQLMLVEYAVFVCVEFVKELLCCLLDLPLHGFFLFQGALRR